MAGLTKLAGVGRHVSSGRRRSLRGRLFIALVAILALFGAAAFAAYAIWDHSHDQAPVRHSRPPEAVPTSVAPSLPTPIPTPTPATLAVTVTGANCQVFVRVPGGDILVNRSLAHGESVRFDDKALSVVLSDGGAVQVYVNGHLRPAGPAGQRAEFTATRQ
jgi:hypothetical protein